MDLTILLGFLVGFGAEIIDGALGMAYGVISNTIMLALGYSPAVASASVHAAEIVTTATSGVSHWRFGNVDKKLFKSLIIPGVIGGVIGAYILVNVPAVYIKPVVAAYLMVMGLVIITRGIKGVPSGEVRKNVEVLGLAGGFCDAIGGGGWGPVVTSTLIARGNTPRYTIGSVNLSEFFVTTAESITFFLTIGSMLNWRLIFGMMLGGVLAAPLGAWTTSRLPVRTLMIMVGLLVLLTSARTLYLALPALVKLF